MPEAERGRGTSLVPPFRRCPKAGAAAPRALLARCAPSCAVSRAFLFLLTPCMNANSSTAFRVFIFKSKEGRRRKRHAQPSQARVGGLGLIETPPAKRLESPSSPSAHFSCLLQAPKNPRVHLSQGPDALATASLASPEQRVRAPCAVPRFKGIKPPRRLCHGCM